MRKNNKNGFFTKAEENKIFKDIKKNPYKSLIFFGEKYKCTGEAIRKLIKRRGFKKPRAIRELLRVKAKCSKCKIIFPIKPSRLKKIKRIFCNVKCFYANGKYPIRKYSKEEYRKFNRDKAREWHKKHKKNG